jgi:PAS domain S-box-containing protein
MNVKTPDRDEERLTPWLLDAISELSEKALGSASPVDLMTLFMSQLRDLTGCAWEVAGFQGVDSHWEWIASRPDAPGAAPIRQADGPPPALVAWQRLLESSGDSLIVQSGEDAGLPFVLDGRQVTGVIACAMGRPGRLVGQVFLLNATAPPSAMQEAMTRSLIACASRALARRREVIAQWKMQADYKALFEKMQEGFALLEVIAGEDGEPVDYRVLDVNPAFEALTQVPADKCIGRPIVKMLDALIGSKPWWLDILASVAKDGASRHFQERFDKIGRAFEAQVFRPEPGRLAATFLDVGERVRAEAMLSRSAVKYRSIFENIQDVYFEASLDDVLLEASPSVEAVFGYGRQELLGRRLTRYYARPLDRKRLHVTILKLWRVSDWEIQMRARDGRIVVCSVSAKLMFDESGSPDRVCGTLRDITLRKRDEMELRNSQAKLSQIVDLVPYPIFARDRDDRHVLANRAHAALFGLSVEQVIGKRPTEIGVAVDDWKKILAVDRDIFAGGIDRYDGDVFLHDSQGRPHYMQVSKLLVRLPGEDSPIILGIAIDVTERRQSELERARLAMAAEQAVEAYVITDVDGKILYVNPAFTSMTGYSREEACGQNPRILKSGKQVTAFYKEMWTTLRGGKHWSGRIVNRRKDGRLYEEDMTIAPVRDADGEVVNYVAVKRDVSREVQLQERLRQGQKMEAIGTLAGGIAHDFNNILSAIVGYTELVMSQLPKDERPRASLEQVMVACQRARDLVKQILTFSRQVESERRPVQATAIAKEALKLLRATLPSTIEIRARVDEGCYPVLADPTQIHQLIMNLCTNAYQAMSENGGVLEFIMRPFRVDDDQPADRPSLRKGEWLLMSVSDTGRGMDRQTIERIFDPFFTTKQKEGGTGLGLATVHGVVTAMEGTITVYSEPDKGSRFNVYLPCLEGGPIQQAAVRRDFPTGAGESVLWIDDEKAILQFGKELLERIGYRVTTASGSLEGLALFRQDPGRFQLVITDQTMPKMTGIQLAQELRKIRPDVPVILSSGFSDAIDPVDIKACGVRALMEKPFTLEDIARAAHEVLHGPDALDVPDDPYDDAPLS